MIKLYLDEDVHKKIATALRLKGYDVISAHEVQKHSLSDHQQFRALPTKATDLHRPFSNKRSLDQILCIRDGRALRNDHTIGYIKAEKVMVEERTDGSMYVTYKNKPLRYREITARSVRDVEPPEPKIRNREEGKAFQGSSLA